MGASALIKGIVSRYLPSPFVDDRDNEKSVRLGRYGEEINLSLFASTDFGPCDEGSMIVATNPTISTGMTWVAAQTTFLDTAPNFYIYNPENPANTAAKSIYLRSLKMIATAVATTAASIQYAIVLDQAQRAPTTDNTATITPVNPNGNTNVLIAPVIKVQNNAVATVIPASSSAKRVVARGCLGGLNIAGDEMLITFGSTDAGAYPGQADAANQPGRRGSSSPPVIVGPGQSCVVHIWMPGSAASFNPEFELTLIAR